MPHDKKYGRRGTHLRRHKEYIEKETKQSPSIIAKQLPAPPPPISVIDQNGKLNRRQRDFLAAFSECGALIHASRISGTSVAMHRFWVKNNPEYIEAFEIAKDYATELLEIEARRRAVNGVKRFKFFKGRPLIDPETGEPYFELEYSDTLLTLLLKANRPDRYRERTEQIVTQTNSGPDAKQLLSQLPVKLRQEILEHLASKQEGRDEKQKLLPAPDLGDDDED